MLTKEERDYITRLEDMLKMLDRPLFAAMFGMPDDESRKYRRMIDEVLASRPEMRDLGNLEDYRITQAQLYSGTEVPALIYRQRVVDDMTYVINMAFTGRRITEDEARTLHEGLDYIQGKGQGL
jgi:hypothetical protein